MTQNYKATGYRSQTTDYRVTRLQGYGATRIDDVSVGIELSNVFITDIREPMDVTMYRAQLNQWRIIVLASLRVSHVGHGGNATLCL